MLGETELLFLSLHAFLVLGYCCLLNIQSKYLTPSEYLVVCDTNLLDSYVMYSFPTVSHVWPTTSPPTLSDLCAAGAAQKETPTHRTLHCQE